MDNKSKYFAMQDANHCASELLTKSTSFYKILQNNFYLEKVRRMWKAYHGAYGSSGEGFDHEIKFTGEQGELTQIHINHFRNLAQHIIVMISANRPTMEARAVNSDYKSLAQTYLANGILDYYMREKRLEDFLKRAVEYAVVMGAGYVKMEWNSTAGEVYDVDPDTGEFNYEGDIEFSNLSPFDVVVDGTKETWDNEWILVRTFKNKYNLMAKYPELADRIEAIPSKSDVSKYRVGLFSNDDTDDIPVYEFFHKRTDAIPEGRYMLFLSDDCVLLDTKMPYRIIPVFRLAAAEILGTPYAYSPMFDVFPIQEAIDATHSAILSNQTNFAVQNLWVGDGSGVVTSNVAGGMNVIESAQKPEALQLCATPEEVFKYLEVLKQEAETISGVNSVARGNPEASLKSGTALALVQSMSLQFMSGLQQNYVKLIEDTGTALIQFLKDFAMTPKVVAIVGKNNKTLLKQFTGEDLSSINRVIVDMGNALARSTAGRVQMAEQMMQMGIIKDPTQYFQVINTGRLDVVFEGDISQQFLIRQENEMMAEGKAPIVSPFDIHALHVAEHRALIDDAEIRMNPALAKVVMDHIQGHIDALTNTDPRILQLTNQQPLPPPGQSMSQNNGGAPQQGGSGGPSDVMNQPESQVTSEAGEQRLPPQPQVDGNLLPNPQLQDQMMGNVK
jgi:carbon monoxide dehydrogenase subunit G